MNEAQILTRWIIESKYLVFFGGAGVSTGSGVPDFRGRTSTLPEPFQGLTPEMVLSSSFLHLHPDLFFEYCRKYLEHPDAKPNAAHLKLAELEQKNYLMALITQNIDSLHQAAGSKAVYPLHGSLQERYCMLCGKRGHAGKTTEMPPKCPDCGGIMRPDITLYGEMPDAVVMRGACREISRADLLIVAGTSLQVEPAASCLSYFHGKHMVIINEEETPWDDRADCVIRGKVEEVLQQIAIEPRAARNRTNWWN